METVKKIQSVGFAAMANFYSPEQKQRLNSMINTLKPFFQEKNISIYYEKVIASELKKEEEEGKILELSKLVHQVDLVLSLGGDGNMLRTARASIGSQALILGINLGNLGFLTDLSEDDAIETNLTQILLGHCKVDTHRYLIAKDNKERKEIAINEIAIRTQGSVISYQVYHQDELILEQISDGLIFATPIGSTGYALSSGGPLVHHSVETLSIIPICPHNLSSRPLILPTNLELTIKIDKRSRSGCVWFFDGKNGGNLEFEKDALTLSYAPNGASVSFVHSNSYSFFRNCKEKLGFGK